MAHHLKFLVSLLLLQAAALVINKLETSPGFGDLKDNLYFSWNDGCVNVHQGFNIKTDKESSILVVDKKQHRLLSFISQQANSFEPKDEEVIVYIVANKYGSFMSEEEHLEAINVIRMYYEETLALPIEIISDSYPQLNFAVLEISPVFSQSYSQEVLTDDSIHLCQSGNQFASTGYGFKFGDQVLHEIHEEPLIFLNEFEDGSAIACSTLEGSTSAYALISLMPCPEDRKISLDLKVSKDRRFKYIIPGSLVFGLSKGGSYQEWKVERIYPLVLQSYGVRISQVDWKDIWPFESLGLFLTAKENIYDQINREDSTSSSMEVNSNNFDQIKRSDSEGFESNNLQRTLYRNILPRRTNQHEVQSSSRFQKDDQVSLPDHPEPWIISFISNSSMAYLYSTFDGTQKNISVSLLSHTPESKRIPMDTRISPDGEYKYIVKGSKVVYRPKGSQILLYCSVSFLSRSNPLSLKCGDTEYTYVNWENVWPMEAVEHHPKYSTPEHNNNNDNSNAEASGNILPLKRTAYNATDIGGWKEKRILANSGRKIFEKGVQVCTKRVKVPLLYASSPYSTKARVVNSLTGKIIYRRTNDLTLLPAKEKIPGDTKMLKTSDGLFYKNILKGSHVLYYHKETDLFYPCEVVAFSQNVPLPNLHCYKLLVVKGVAWNDLVPIEAYDLVKDRAKIYGIENEEVTTEKLRSLIGNL